MFGCYTNMGVHLSRTTNPDKMTYTVKQWADKSGINPDSARKRATRIFRKAVGQMSELTPDEWAQVYPDKEDNNAGQIPDSIPAKSRIKNKRVSNVRPSVKEPAADINPKLRWPDIAVIRRTALDVLLIGIVIGHAALIWYDCAALWGEPGQIGGGLAFGIILAAVMFATDPAKNITSQYALFLALLVDAAAYWVHFPTFQTYSVPDAITSVLCVFLCAMSFGALFLYRHQKNN